MGGLFTFYSLITSLYPNKRKLQALKINLKRGTKIYNKN